MNRESWLTMVIGRLRPVFEGVQFSVPEKIRASCSWPSKSGLAQKKRCIGEAWSAENSGDHSFEVFISPVLKDPLEVAATLVHELVHCAVGLEEKHRGLFSKCARAIGLEGKMIETVAGENLKAQLQQITDEIGPYPHAELKHSNAPPKQGTRMRKVVCTECGCIVRMTRRWMDDAGLPTCGCGVAMAIVDEESCESGVR